MDDFEGVSRGRTRRALGLIAIGLALALVGGIVYLRPFARAPAETPAPTPGGHFNLPADMQWLSGAEGWLVYNDGQNQSTLFHTQDAGRHWQRNFLVSNGHAAGLRFFDSRRGVLPIYGEAGGVRVLQTEDGGRSWRPVPLPSLVSTRASSSATPCMPGLLSGRRRPPRPVFQPSSCIAQPTSASTGSDSRMQR
ncbi:MAG: WD40/YVTN/BNR-like repeat-containing protein [Candidatus Dormibacter sp.]|uniref:WD40/YVTN/BNR-like repeat-containing protein n=1 Tax=Candidatus Dormibacter sp. TaxID=2973982 RepID=UPI00268BA6C6